MVCDILPTEGDPRWHIQADVTGIIYYGWDMMIAHPPCTYLANSGVRWLRNMKTGFNSERVEKMEEAALFFKMLLNAPIKKIAVENPVQHYHCQIKKPDQIIQPWMFGNNESKAVCLWLKGLPKLTPTVKEKPGNTEQRVWRMPPGPDRQKERSRFFPGIAAAMADQWGNI